VLACFGSIMLVFFVVLFQVRTDSVTNGQKKKASVRSAGQAASGDRNVRIQHPQPRREREERDKEDGAVASGDQSKKKRQHRDRHVVPRVTLPQDSIYRLTVEDHMGDPFSLERLSGYVTLVVNTACK